MTSTATGTSTGTTTGTATGTATGTTTGTTTGTVAGLITFLETGSAPDGLFAPTVFSDLSLPQWRLQAETAQELIALRAASHSCPGRVRVERIEGTEHGFTLEFEERWVDEGQEWYCREMIRADVVDGSIVDLKVYCTGDWDEDRRREHARSVRLIRT